MSKTPSEQSIETLKGVSVATLATALYKRGFRNQVIQDVRPVRAHHNLPARNNQPNMVGPAFTLRYMPCLLYTSPSPRDYAASRMPSSA